MLRIFIIFISLGLILFLGACYNRSEQIANEVANIYGEGTMRAEQATSVDEIGNLTKEIANRIQAIEASDINSDKLSPEKKTDLIRIKNEYYNAVNASTARLTGGKTPVWISNH